MILISAWLIRPDKDEVAQFLDRHASRAGEVADESWNYPELHNPLLFLNFDPYVLDEIEEAEDIEYLVSKDAKLSFLVVSMRLCLSRKGRFSETVDAAQYLTIELLSNFDGFADDNEDVFWDYDEIKNGTKKNGLQFLETEYGYGNS